MRDINPRRFNKLVYVEQAGTAQDDTTKAVTPAYTLYCTRYASIEPVSGRELHQAKAVEADLTHMVTMYWDRTTAGITPRHRLRYNSPVYGDRYLNIISAVNVEERNRLIEIKATEQTE